MSPDHGITLQAEEIFGYSGLNPDPCSTNGDSLPVCKVNDILWVSELLDADVFRCFADAYRREIGLRLRLLLDDARKQLGALDELNYGKLSLLAEYRAVGLNAEYSRVAILNTLFNSNDPSIHRLKREEDGVFLTSLAADIYSECEHLDTPGPLFERLTLLINHIYRICPPNHTLNFDYIHQVVMQRVDGLEKDITLGSLLDSLFDVCRPKVPDEFHRDKLFIQSGQGHAVSLEA